jgi:hypothetical protein
VVILLPSVDVPYSEDQLQVLLAVIVSNQMDLTQVSSTDVALKCREVKETRTRVGSDAWTTIWELLYWQKCEPLLGKYRVFQNTSFMTSSLRTAGGCVIGVCCNRITPAGIINFLSRRPNNVSEIHYSV